MDQEMKRPMTEAEKERLKAGISKETIAVERIWNKRPDGFAIKMPTKTKTGELVILEFKRMSCVTDQYVTLNEKDLHDNLTYFKVPEASIESIRSKLALKTFDEYTSI
jgi:hypothetical protein